MYIYWDYFTAPLLDALRPKRIIEIGTERGKHTRLLLAWCQQHDAVLHSIDPAPRFDVAAWQEQSGSRFIFHQTTSLAVLPELPPADVIFIDGDHNWYTVFHELKGIEAQCQAQSCPFPVVLLHDVGWPYGRRDLYYNPTTIPESFRHSYARKGLRPGKKELQEDGGLNAGLCHATTQRTPRNGVRTAVEDFLKETQAELDLCLIPGFHGLGLIFSPVLCKTHTGFAQLLATWRLSPALRQHIQLLEAQWIQKTAQNTDLTQTLHKLLSASHHKLAQAQQRIERLSRELAAAQAGVSKEKEQGEKRSQGISQTEV